MGTTFHDRERRYFLSCDVNLCVKLRIECLEGQRPVERLCDLLKDPNFSYAGRADKHSELYVTAQVWADGRKIGLPLHSGYQSSSQARWNEWLTFTMKYRDLPATAQVALTVWDVFAPRCVIPVGGTTLRLFGKKMTLKKGRQKLLLWMNEEADGSEPSGTPGKFSERNEAERLDKLIKKYDRGELSKVEWLDKLSFRQIERISEVEASHKHVFLVVELPHFEHRVSFIEEEHPLHVPFPAVSHSLVLIHEPDLGHENPVETKIHKLAKNLIRGLVDRDLRPNATERKQLTAILNHPPSSVLTPDEKYALWKFRFSLTREKRALTKFFKSVDWSDASEVTQATELMAEWAPPDVDDILELLSSHFTSEAAVVRTYAVKRLAKADDEVLQSFLLQLVQALRYEGSEDSELARLLIRRATKNYVFGNFFFWYLRVECEDKKFSHLYTRVQENLLESWNATPEGVEMVDQVKRQEGIIMNLLSATRDLKGTRQKKLARVQAALGPGGPFDLTHFSTSLLLPIEPDIRVTGVNDGDIYLFKSNLNPMKLVFRTEARDTYAIIFKSGDDIRQDQLVIQMIELMDNILKKENLDLKLTPYRVLATGVTHGMVAFVPSHSLATILSENKNDIQRFFQRHAPAPPPAPYGISPDVLDTFVKSSAGYSVITYLLGIGDRHLDNLMLTTSGNLFHVDFSYILGRDPKPFPPPMKLCKEMVECMGGANSPHYLKFKSYCCEAYNILRKYSNLIMNLFLLMSDSNIPDVQGEAEKSVLKLQEKMRPHISDEEAVQHFQDLINESVSALFPQITETIHKWAQYWRS